LSNQKAKTNKSKKKSLYKKNKNKMIKAILPISIIIVVMFILYKIISLIVAPTEIFVIKNDKISAEENEIGYVIREEKIIKGNNYTNGLVQIKAEGEKVAKGDHVFRYHSSSEEELNKKIDELNIKIQEALLGQNDLFPRDIKAIDDQIENKIDGIKTKNDLQEIIEYKNDINTYITKKSKIAGDLSQSGSYINELIKERETYQTQLKSNCEYVNAPMSGVVSYRVDGFEEELKPNEFEKLSNKYLEELDLSIGQIATTNSEMGKIINNYECYIATVIDSPIAKEATQGKKVKLRLSTQDVISATISYISKQNDNSVLVVFQINNCVEKLIDYRKISFDVIWWQYEGLKIPKTAMIYENGLSYVVRNRAGYKDKILVEILKENDNYCIIDNYNNEDLKELGFSSNDIMNMKKITIYDQIVLDPQIESLER
jgi:putative membrane fusion protein